jgi:two-component system, LytTR family, sensor kinase
MAKKAILLMYVFFFFMYFVGFEWMYDLKSGVPFSWSKLIKPLRLAWYTYTIITVLLAHFIVFRKYYNRKPRLLLAGAIGGLLVFFILFRYLLEEIIFPATLGFGNYYPPITFRYYTLDNVYYGSVTIFIGFVFFLFDESFSSQKQKNTLMQHNREAELNFLQVQMNPHFLFNSLNNIYSMALEQHPKTATSVLMLSEMMRYVTYQRESNIVLEKELEFVRSMAAIHQLRYDFTLNLQIDAAPDTLPCKVIPLLLPAIVENALKYGDLSDPQVPLHIASVRLKDKLQLTVINKISGRQVEPGGGLGLKNLQRRLELSYRPDSYCFSIEKKGNVFCTELLIPIL